LQVKLQSSDNNIKAVVGSFLIELKS
jgi:hypothetical protein